jgi:hypothetical protein
MRGLSLDVIRRGSGDPYRKGAGSAPTRSRPAVPLRAFDFIELGVVQRADDEAIVELAPGLLTGPRW